MEERGLDDRELHAWRSFFRMQEVLRGRIEQQLQAANGLSNADYTVLVALADDPAGRARLVELGRFLGWEKSRLHHQLTRMCKRGLVRRESAATRAMFVVLTPEGRDALEKAAPCHAAHVRRLTIDPLTDEQIDQLAEISTAILANLEADQQPSR
ncbi:transcriptional regulator [Parafrankia soli]|uniref:Transcriptional regulator n=1 Tax=Parafrankia soli TaxID=2599596 RepID=A0A1S1PWJ3_9ACTN|nr:MarR family winged helix-turn-helix transcriptional regulator [Parafrankia soli]OHV25686.1 transcriptional regulator [Parafrankia soli]